MLFLPPHSTVCAVKGAPISDFQDRVATGHEEATATLVNGNRLQPTHCVLCALGLLCGSDLDASDLLQEACGKEKFTHTALEY